MKVLLTILCLAWPTLSWCSLSPERFNAIEQAGFDLLVDNHLEGSGVMIDPSGLGLIAGHAAKPQTKKLEARSPTLGRLNVRVIALDLGHDLALVKFPPRSQPYPFRPIATKPLRPGEPIFLYAAPLYRHGVLIRGAVGSTRPTYEYLPDVGYYVRILHVSAASPPGTSGGPWLNDRGEVVGLQSGLMHESGAPVGLAYMSPRSAIVRLVNTKKTVSTMSIGAGLEEFWEQSGEFRRHFRSDQEGIVLVKIDPKGAAAQSGLKDGDVVTHVDKTPIAYRNDLLARVRRIKPGRTVTVVVTRSHHGARTVKITPVALEK